MSTLSNFGIPGTPPGILHPKHRHLFRVTFVGLGKLVPGTNDRDLIRQVIQTDLPNLSFEEVQLNRYNSTAYVIGKHTWEAISMTVEDDITGLASAAIRNQLETQQRIVGVDLDGRWLNRSATGSDYKFAIKLDQLDGDEGIVQTWALEGCQIMSAAFGDREYASSDAATIQLSIRFDHARMIDGSNDYGTALAGNVAG